MSQQNRYPRLNLEIEFELKTYFPARGVAFANLNLEAVRFLSNSCVRGFAGRPRTHKRGESAAICGKFGCPIQPVRENTQFAHFETFPRNASIPPSPVKR